MYKYLMAVVLCLPLSCRAWEMENAIGVGVQYGGIVGWQGSFTEENAHTRFALGLLGISAGYDYNFSPSFSIGGTLMGGVFMAATTNLNYYLSGDYNHGWRIGLDAGVGMINGSGMVAGKTHPILLLSAGYAF